MGRLETVKAKFDDESYDYGQFKYNEEELYCNICDVWTRSRDQMQAHKEGANHKEEYQGPEIPMQTVLDRSTLSGHPRQPYEGQGSHKKEDAVRRSGGKGEKGRKIQVEATRQDRGRWQN